MFVLPSTPFVTLFTLFGAVLSVPVYESIRAPGCLQGSCSYKLNLPDTNTAAVGNLVVIGSANLISDITEDAGWLSWDCQKGSEHHEVRLTCSGSKEQCEHVFQGGAKDTIVRVPSSCGLGPFARVADFWQPDEVLPDTVRASIGRKKASAARVYAFKLDTNFGAIPTDKGTVSFAATAANTGTESNHLTVETLTKSLQKSDMRRAAGLQSRSNIITDFLNEIIGHVKDATSIHKNTNGTVNIDFKKNNIPIMDVAADCNGIAGGGHVKLDADVKGHMTFGYAVVGTLVPLHVEDFGLYAGLTANITSAFHVNAEAMGTFDSTSIPIFEVGLPYLDYPGILRVGPAVVIGAQFKATAGLTAAATLSGNYNIPAVEFVYPAKHGKSNGQMKTNKGPFKLKWGGELQALGTIDARLQPKIVAGLSFFNGMSNADLYLSLEAGPSLSGHAKISDSGPLYDSEASSSGRDIGNGTSTLIPEACAALNANMKVRAGIQGGIRPLFEQDFGLDLFSKSLELWKDCMAMGNESAPEQPPRKIKEIRGTEDAYAAKRDGMKCVPSLSIGPGIDLLV